MSEEGIVKAGKRTSQRMDLVSETGFGKFLRLLYSVSSEGLISLGVGEPDFPTPWHICEAAVDAMRKGLTGYTPSPGFPELRLAVAEDIDRRYGVKYDPESEILITVGSSEAMDLAFRAILNPGDEVIISDPHYVCYPSCVSLAQGVAVSVPTAAENGFKLEAAQIEARLTPRTKVILVGYPANPTGTEMERGDLVEIAGLAENHDLLIVSDEVYSALTYGVEHTCFASLPGMKERTILLDGFSKRYAMTGWRLGYAAGPADLIWAMGKIHQHTMLSAASMAQKAALEALKGGVDDTAEMVAEYGRRRKVMLEGVRKMGLECHEPKGAFYVFPSIRATGLTSAEFAERLLVEEKVVVIPGNLFGQQGEGFVRCCYAAAMRDIEEALRRMERFVGPLL